MKKLLVYIILLNSLLLINTTDLFAGTCNLKLSPDNRFLVHTDGTPFFPTGDTCWEIPWDLDRSEVETYLQTRKDQHFNTVCINSFDWNQSRNSANRYGAQPFVMVGDKYDPAQPITTAGNDPNNGTEYDYWDNLEYIIDLAVSKGMFVALLPCWGDTRITAGDSSRMFYTESSAYNYGNWIAQRFINQTNIIWMMGGDTIPGGLEAIYRAMAEGVADGNNGVNLRDGNADYSTTLMSYHPPKWTHSSSYWFPNDAFMDFNSTQDQPSDQINRIWNDWGLTPAKATWLFEGGYEERGTSSGTYGAWQCRFQAYQTVFAGGFGQVYGHMSIWDFDSDWATKMHSEGGYDMQHINALMASLTDEQYLTRAPDLNLIDGNTGSMTGSEGMFSSCIVATTVYDRDFAMIYAANGGNIRVKMETLAGPTLDARWFDPREGNWSSAGTDIPSGAGAPIVEFDTPGTPANGNDWVLILGNETEPEPDPDPEPMPGVTNVCYTSSTIAALPIQPRNDDLAQLPGTINTIMKGGMHSATPDAFPYLFNSDAVGSYGPSGDAIFQDGISPNADTVFHCDFSSPKTVSEIHVFSHWGDERLFTWFEVWASTSGTNESDYTYVGTATFGEIGESNAPYAYQENVARLYDPNDGIILDNVTSLKFIQKNCAYGISSNYGRKVTPGTALVSPYVSINGSASPEIDVIAFSITITNEFFSKPTIAELPFQPRNDDLAQAVGTTKSILAGGMHTAWGDNQFDYMFNSQAYGDYGTGSSNSPGGTGVLLWDAPNPNTTSMVMHIDFADAETVKEIRIFSFAEDVRIFNYAEVSYSTSGSAPYTYLGAVSFGNWGDLAATYASSNCLARLYNSASEVLATDVKSLEITMRGICDNWTWDLTKKISNGGGSVINEIDVIGIPEPATLLVGGLLLGLAFLRRY